MKRWMFLINGLIIVAFLMTACGPSISDEEPLPPSPTSIPTSIPEVVPDVSPTKMEEDVLYLNLVWHQHQPLYYKNEDGVYTRPWVRVHATKDYYDMASILEQYPEVKITFNLTPVLIKQLEDYSKNNSIDLYWEYSLISANQLSIEQKEFILTRFFDVNWDNIIARFPRYQELLNKRGGASKEEISKAMESFTESDFRDLQIWFNLAWFDPDFLNNEPLSELVKQQKNFSEEDKMILFSEAKRIIDGVIPIHRKLQDNGQIEVITTPYAHPILPLLIDSNIARVGNPTTDLPPRFSYPQDAIAHLAKSNEIYEENFGQLPKGLWPGEGSVGQLMVPYVIQSGYKWMASGEPVLAKSIGIDSFTRDSNELVNEADLLYRPYYVKNQNGEKVAIFFRDGVLSDKIGFTYSGQTGNAAARDLMNRLENIREKLKSDNSEGPHIVSIIVDGENAWEYYKNDGKEFFHAFYQALSESSTIKTITPSNYLENFPEQNEIDDLFPGAWFSPNYDTWIGEAEENQAWDYLLRTRAVLAQYDISKTKQASEETIAEALDYMYLAEGSDWFWWYGVDQDSGQDGYFDEGFRALLRNVFLTLGEPVPVFVNVPIIEDKPVPADQSVSGFTTPKINGFMDENEWENAGIYKGDENTTLPEIKFLLDQKNIYFLINPTDNVDNSKIAIYLKSPRGTFSSYSFTHSEGSNTRLLGFQATHLVEWSDGTVQNYEPVAGGWKLQENNLATGQINEVIEIGIPLEIFGQLETGDGIQFIVIEEETKTRIPENGPGQIYIPDMGLATIVLKVDDPEGDDYGPGTYTYPTDVVFPAQAFDLKSFQVAYDENNVIFKIELFGPISNPWGSPNNLAIQTIDVYIDQDPGNSTGARKLLPGRNLSLSEENGWDIAFWAEGWTPQILSPDPETLEPKEITTADFNIIVDPSGRSVTLRVAKSVFNDENYEKWGYAVVISGQEGYPSTGVWRVRDVNQIEEQWRFGGAGNSTNHTRVIDMIWPIDYPSSQVEMLSTFITSNKNADNLEADDYAIIELLIP